MADRVVRLADGRVAGVERNTRRDGRGGTAVVRMPARIPILDRKLLRDLWEMKGQALAIASVIAAGVTMFVTYMSNFDSLRRTRARLLRRGALRRRVRVAETRARQPRGPHRGDSRRRCGRDAGHCRRHARCSGHVGAASGRLISLPERGGRR